MNKTCAIVLNGKKEIRNVEGDFVICADGGADLLKNRKADLIIGDFDSLGKIPDGVEFLKFPKEKNETDGELCVKYAAEHGFLNINIYGALGGRFDHSLGNLGLLAYADSLGAEAVAKDDDVNVFFAKGKFELKTEKGCLVSVVPFGGAFTVEHSENLYYPLENLEILPFQSRGLSNFATADSIVLKIKSGTALVFRFSLNSDF